MAPRRLAPMSEGFARQMPISRYSSGSLDGSDSDVDDTSCKVRHSWPFACALVVVVLVCGMAFWRDGQYANLAQDDHFRPGVTEDVTEATEGCHDIGKGDRGACLAEIEALRRAGTIPNPGRFTGGLGAITVPDKAASLAEWQAVVYKISRGKCPRPCSLKPSTFCQKTAAPVLWKPDVASESLRVKVLSYNLYWWNLFTWHKGVYKGVKNSAGKLIAGSMAPPYDIIGFQECENPTLVLEPVGLLEKFEVFQGKHAICMAYRKSAWKLLERGEEDVAEDQATEYYGLRGSQWMRLQHQATGTKVFFMNHHGPLHVNSGGECGGVVMAHTLLNIIARKGERGDVIVLIGDFNANAASLTIQELWKHLVLHYSGDSFGGVDNMFSNLGVSSLVEAINVGTGGSDHNATSVTLDVGPNTGASHPNYSGLEPAKAVRDSIETECGLLETGVQYVFRDDAWTRHIDGPLDPRECCKKCKKSPVCKAWLMVDWVSSTRGPRCTLKGGEVIGKARKDGVMSGLPPQEASRAAARAATEAIFEL